MRKIYFFLVTCCIGACRHILADSSTVRSVPGVEKNPLLLDSYLPATMQVIAYLTELMKYNVRPVEDDSPSPGGSATSTTLRPTPAHSPAIFSPQKPLGPSAYFARTDAFRDYVDRLKSRRDSDSYFDRYHEFLVHDQFREGVEEISESPKEENARATFIASNLDLLMGRGPSGVLREINRLDYDFVDDKEGKEEEKTFKFLNNYDDDFNEGRDLKGYIIGNKQIPPTRAYVTLLTFYDNLNKEAKKLQLNKYGGYVESVLRVLEETSRGTSAEQLNTILKKMKEEGSSRDQYIINKTDSLISDLENPKSYLNEALQYIPPLQFNYY